MCDITWPQGKVYIDAQNYKKLYPKVIDLWKILKMRAKNIIKFANFFVFVLNCTNCEDVYIESKLKVEINESTTLLRINESSTLYYALMN